MAGAVNSSERRTLVPSLLCRISQYSIRHPRTCSFVLSAKSVATYCAAAKRQRLLCLCSECVEVWVVMQIANCAGHRGKSEGNGSFPTRRAEGGRNWCEPPSLPSPSLSLSLPFSCFFTLSTLNWQLAGK